MGVFRGGAGYLDIPGTVAPHEMKAGRGGLAADSQKRRLAACATRVGVLSPLDLLRYRICCVTSRRFRLPFSDLLRAKCSAAMYFRPYCSRFWIFAGWCR
jgi:hypothetical protein